MSRPRRAPARVLALEVICASCAREGRWTPGADVVRHDGHGQVCVVRLPEQRVASKVVAA